MEKSCMKVPLVDVKSIYDLIVCFISLLLLSSCVSSSVQIRNQTKYEHPSIKRLLFVPSNLSGEFDSFLAKYMGQGVAEYGTELILTSQDITIGDGYSFEEIREKNNQSGLIFDGILSIEKGDTLSVSYTNIAHGTSYVLYYPFHVQLFSISLNREIWDAVIQLKTSAAGVESLCKELTYKTLMLLSKNRILPGKQKSVKRS